MAPSDFADRPNDPISERPKTPMKSTRTVGEPKFKPKDAAQIAERMVAAWYPAFAPELYKRKLVEAIWVALLRAYSQGRADGR